MIVAIARVLFNVTLILGGLLAALGLFQVSPGLSFHVAFWGITAACVLRSLTKVWPALGVFFIRIKFRLIVLREALIVGLVYGLGTYLVLAMAIASLKAAGWDGATSPALDLSPAFAIAVLFPFFGLIIGLFCGRINLTETSFGLSTRSHIVSWFICQGKFSKINTEDPSVIRGRALRNYGEAFRALIGGRLPHLWFQLKDVLGRPARAYRQLKKAIRSILFTPIQIPLLAAKTESKPDRKQPATPAPKEETTQKQEVIGKEAPALAKKAKRRQQNGRRLNKKSKSILQWVQDTLKFEKNGAAHPPEEGLVLKQKVRKVNVNRIKIYWAYSVMSLKDAVGHFLVVGTTGSGKTVQIRLLMQSVFKNFGKGLNQRAVVYDGKREYIPILLGMDIKVPIHILNPFDARSVPWNIAEDVNTPAAAWQIASIFIPEEHSVQPFFADASRQILYGVLYALLKTAPYKWTLRDVVLICRNKERISRTLGLTEETKEIRENYFSEKKTLNGILSTLDTKLAPVRIVAALWDWSVIKRKAVGVSVHSWIKGESIFVLGHHVKFSESVTKINAALLRTFSDVIVSQPDTSIPSSWLFLDELREGPKVESLASINNQGRSKGAVLVMGIQNLSGFQHVYNDKLAEEILGQTRYKSCLRIDSHTTAKWVQEHFGEQLVVEQNRSAGSSSGGSASRGYQSKGGFNSSQGQNWGTNDSVAESHQIRSAVLAADVQGFPPPSPETGFRGVHDIPSVGPFHTHISWEWVMSNLEPTSGEGCIERDDSEQDLRPWTEEDSERIGIKPNADGTDDSYFTSK
jgi:hypothetical protein